jgi:hypothetical protein
MALTRPRYSQIYDTDYKQSVRVATTEDVGNLFIGNTQPNVIDGVTLRIADRILVKDQANTTQNGIYSVRATGTGSNGWWTRSLDADQNGFITSGMTTIVSEGNINPTKTFRLTTVDPIYIGNTALTFTNPFASTTSAGGLNTQIQFNDSTVLGGSAGLTFNKTSNLVTTGGNVIVSGNIIAAQFIGNGAQLTGLPAGYSNVQVATYLPTYSGVVTASNVAVNGNVTAQYVLGSGQFLTGLPAGYSNVNVKAYTESMGFQNYGNANVTAYTVSMGFTNFSNANVAAYLSGNVTLGSLTTPGALNTLAGNVTIYGASSMLNIIGNIVVNNTAIASSNVTGAIRTTGGIGVGGNLDRKSVV